MIVEFLPFVYEVSSITYCQEEHLGISGYLFVITLKEVGLCFWEFNSIKLGYL